MIERTKGLQPYMIVVTDNQDRIVAHMLAMLRRRGAWIPPYIFTQGRIYGEGCYRDEEHKSEIFSMMLDAITSEFHKHLCFYIEFSNISKKMFGYKYFRNNHYFPVPWMQIHNSLHSKPPEERLTDKTLEKISQLKKYEMSIKKASTPAEIHAFYKLLKSYNRFRFQRYIPHEDFFQEFAFREECGIFVTYYKKHIVGGSAVIVSNNNAYIWFEASKKKLYQHIHPDLYTTWEVIKHSAEIKCDHVYFMNVGLPFKRSSSREFILNFGGKPVSTYRWFRFTFDWLNRLLTWCFQE